MGDRDARGRWLALVLATLALMLCFAVWGVISPLAPIFRQRYALSAVEASILIAVPVILGSLARIPLGILTDRYGGRIVFSVLLLALVVPVALAGLTASYVTLVLVSFFLGLGGAAFAIGVPFVARWFPPERQGMALGIYGVGNLGTAISAFLAPRVAEGAGVSMAFWMFLPALVALAIIFWLVGRDAPGPRPPRLSLGERLAIFQRRPLAWVLALFYFVTFGGFVAIGAYLPTLLVDAYSLDRADAGTRAAGFVIVATIMRPVGGTVADRMSSTTLLNVIFAIVALLAIVLAFEPGIIGITVAFLGIAAMVGLGNGVIFKLVAAYFAREAGTVTGLVGAAGGLGGFFPPLLMGFVNDTTGSYAVGFMLLSEVALVCLIINLLALQQRARQLMPGEGGGT